MKIGLDYISAFGQGGNATYTRELIKGLAEIDQRNSYYLYTYLHKLLPFYKNEIVDQENFHYRTGYFCWPYEFFLKNINIFNQRLLFKKSKRDKLDLFHLTNPLKFNNRINNFVVTIHDICGLKEPGFAKEYSINFYQKNLKNILDKSQAIIAVSQSTKKDLLDSFNVSPKKIFVVYEGVSNIFKPKPNKEYLKKKFNIDKEYILSVGQIQPRKNLSRLFQAYAHLPFSLREKHQLVVVGRARDKIFLEKLISQIGKLKIRNQVIFLDRVEISDLPYLYSSAIVFVYVSLCEGFGLPILESLACGRPVITSNISSLPEVVGPTGLLVNPYSITEIKNALGKILTDKNLRATLSKKAIKHSQLFTWKKTAQGVLDVYQKIIEGKK